MAKLSPKAFYQFWWSIFWGFLLIFFLIAILPGTFLAVFRLFNTLTALIVTIIILALAVSAIWAKLLYNSYSYEMQRTSLNIKWGVVRKHSATIPYQRIQNIDINRGIIARLLGLSDVWVQTAGTGGSGFSQFGALRFSEGVIPGLVEGDAEKMRNALLKKIKGRKSL